MREETKVVQADKKYTSYYKIPCNNKWTRRQNVYWLLTKDKQNKLQKDSKGKHEGKILKQHMPIEHLWEHYRQIESKYILTDDEALFYFLTQRYFNNTNSLHLHANPCAWSSWFTLLH